MLVKRTYKLPSVKYSCKGFNKAILTNNYGSYYSVDETSSYQGWHIFDSKSWRMKKVIESIIPLHEGACVELSTQQYNIQREYESGAKEVLMMYRNTLLYSQIGLKGKLKLILDNRDSYDQSEMGRFYSVERSEDFILISFVKKNETGKKDSSGILLEDEYSYIGIKGIKNSSEIGKWVEKKYSQNSSRKAHDTYWVYEALELEPRNHVVFSYAESPGDARTLADISYYHFEEILSNVAEDAHQKYFSFPQLPLELDVASSMAAHSLQSLIQNLGTTKGIFAGFPWFFQLWSRDELISLGGLIALAKQSACSKNLLLTIKKILDRHIQNILPDGTLANRFPNSVTGSIDSIGWLGKRTQEFFELLQEKKELYTLYSPNELKFYFEKLLEAKKKLLESRKGLNGFIANKSQETWMDTIYLDDGRSGERIEIQSLFYSLYSSIIYLGKIAQIDSKKTLLRNLVKEQKEFKKLFSKYFLHDDFVGGVIDGITSSNELDLTIRPNVFLAMYIAPDLFSKRTSKKIINAYLKSLYLSWGGLSSLDKSSHLFESSHTGENDKSYHRGDSWYFINNIFAMVLFRVDPATYTSQINDILSASTKDILEQGYMGTASELSSASHQEAQGALHQAWSASTYIESICLIHQFDE